MIYSQNIVKYLLFFVFSQFLMAASSFANPIPVFCLYDYGFIKNSTQWSSQFDEKHSIVEYRAGSGFPAATYSLNSNNTIVEYRAGSGFPAATYSLNSNNTIVEYRAGSGFPAATYSLNSNNNN